jgi:hypothetical protein
MFMPNPNYRKVLLGDYNFESLKLSKGEFSRVKRAFDLFDHDADDVTIEGVGRLLKISGYEVGKRSPNRGQSSHIAKLFRGDWTMHDLLASQR